MKASNVQLLFPSSPYCTDRLACVLVRKTQSETMSLRRTEQIIKDRIADVDGHLREREEIDGVGGYLDARKTLEANGELAVDLNAAKGHTLENISNVVSRIAKLIDEKKETLQPQMDLLKEKKAMVRAMEQEHKEKRERYERLSSRFAADRQALEKEAARLQDEWNDTERAYCELQLSKENVEANVKKLEDYTRVNEEYADKLAQQESILQQLGDEKQKIVDRHSEDSKQRRLFQNLEKLLRLKQAMREKRSGIDGEEEDAIGSSPIVAF